MTITLKFTVKDGKTPIEASIEGLETEQVVGEYQRLLGHFAGAGSPPPAAGRGKKPAQADAAECAEGSQANPSPSPAASDATPSGSRKLFSKTAIQLNETAVTLASRLAVCIPQFREKSPIEIVQQLNFDKPLAAMTSEELLEVVGRIRTTLAQWAAHNPGAAAYLTVVEVIDTLKEGSDEEWSVARQGITAETWGVLNLEGNAFLMDCAKTYLQSRQASLRSINAAAEMAAIA